MAAMTIGSHHSYARNLWRAAHDFFVALLALDRTPRIAGSNAPVEGNVTSALVPYCCWSADVELGDHTDSMR